MDGKLDVSLDKLPIKRLEAIEENGVEHFPPDVGYDEKRLSLIRRIDFGWALEKDDNKKQKKSLKENSNPWPFQSMLENLQLARQELNVIIDLINTVEANDAVAVVGMTRPKLLPNEVLSDLAVSAATKLQCFRHLGKYFKQSAKALEQQVAREARFYGALIRLQQNWKVKRQRMTAAAPGSDGFIIDLFDNSLYDPTAVIRPSLSTVRIDHDSAGMLAINLPPSSCRSLHFDYLGVDSSNNQKETKKMKPEPAAREPDCSSVNDDVCVKESHSLIREVHRAIFDEQVFDLINREAFSPSLGANVTGLREHYLQLSVGQGISVLISLVPSYQGEQTAENSRSETAVLPFDSLEGVKLPEEKQDDIKRFFGFPNRTSCEIHLEQIFHEHVFVRGKDEPVSVGSRLPVQPVKDRSGLLGHFCRTLAHNIFSNSVLSKLENVVCRVPYLHLVSHPTWHSRTSSWTVFMMVPQSILHANSQFRALDSHHIRSMKSQFRTKVVVTDELINVEGEGAPNVVDVFKGRSADISSTNRYDCNLSDLPITILQQVASQVIRWLHEEAMLVGIKSNRDFLSLSFELEQGESLSLVAHVDPEHTEGCISWWLVMDDGFTEERKLSGISDKSSEYKKFLGYLSLEVLHSTLMDLVCLCNGVGNH